METVRFKPGEAYWGTATLDHNQKKVFLVTGRGDRTVSLSHVNDLVQEHVDVVDGREVVRVADDSFEYVLSASVPVDIDRALAIVKACRVR